MTDTRVFKVIVGLEDGTLCDCAAYEYQGAIWLVPKWLPFPEEGYAKPERMIRLDQFRHQRFDPPAKGPGFPVEGADFGLNDPLPRALLDGELTPTLKARYVVLDRPDAKFRVGELGINHAFSPCAWASSSPWSYAAAGSLPPRPRHARSATTRRNAVPVV